ncbi:MAG: MFS transporter [Phycisphaerales bacterium]
MSTTSTHAPCLPATPIRQRAPRLGVTVVSHAVIDFFSFTAPPLLTVLEGHLKLTPEQGAFLLGIGALCNGLVQPAAAWLSDRFNTRIFGWLGLALAVVGVGLIGYAGSYSQLLFIQIASSVGIGAFHPIAAAAAGQLSGSRRSFGVALFYCAGMAGGIAGNIGAPFWVGHFDGESARAGLRAIAWFIPPGLMVAIGLLWAIHHIPHRHAAARAAHATLSDVQRRERWRAVALLYVGNLLRFGVDTALIVLITRWCEQAVLRDAGAGAMLSEALRQQAAELSGPLQAAKQLGMGVCGLVAGWFVTGRYEKRSLVFSPLVAAGAIALFPQAPGGMTLVLLLIAGVGYGGFVPLTISLAQRLLPHRTSLASSLMMGGAWSVAAMGAVGAQAIVDSAGIAAAFHATAGLSLLGAAASMALPNHLLESLGTPAARGEGRDLRQSRSRAQDPPK